MENKIHEYAEEMPVEIVRLTKSDGDHYKNVISDQCYKAHIEERWVIVAQNEGGCNCTQVDLIDVLRFVKEKMPELWQSINT